MIASPQPSWVSRNTIAENVVSSAYMPRSATDSQRASTTPVARPIGSAAAPVASTKATFRKNPTTSGSRSGEHTARALAGFEALLCGPVAPRIAESHAGNVQMSAALDGARRRALLAFRRLWRVQDHGALIRSLLADTREPSQRPRLFVETGCGLSTFALAEVAARVGAEVYSCDANADKIAELRARGADALANVHFVEGDSLASLARIAARHEHIDFALFDSAPSATHTLREFQLLEPRLGAGSRVLVDDAAPPRGRLLLSPCPQGKPLLPYPLPPPLLRGKAHPP